ncbi:MAG: phosphotransferase, partial [Frankia sp.]|nr:phosphotransferase [Frankia sp.]
VGPLRFESVIGDAELPAHLIGTEQSNSSLVFGDDFILKLYRRLTDGVNPDLEVTRALAAVGCEVVAEPLGWFEGVGATLGLLQRYFRSGTEGWPLAITSVRDLYAERDLHADEVGGDFAFDAHRLGVTTALLHRDLAKALPARVAEPGAAVGVAKQMHERLDAAVEAVAALAPYADGLRATYDDVAAVNDPVPIQRIHGDYHLGQVLRVETGWVVLDFEGEPIRSLEERTALMSPLRDVAGMLRSFDYAARHLLAERPGDPGLSYRADEWAERNSDAFCRGYAEVAGADPRASGVLLRAFLLDKAVYEVVYEARHRPTWLPIPLGAVERLTANGG